MAKPIAVNNDFVTLYADLFSTEYPAHGDFFQKRRRTSESKAAYAIDIEISDNGPREPNAAHDHALTEIAHLSSKEFSR